MVVSQWLFVGVDFGLGSWVLEGICFLFCLFFLFYDFNNDKMERQSREGVTPRIR